jgi:hypothetical protein
LKSLQNPTPTPSAALRFHPELPPEALQALHYSEQLEQPGNLNLEVAKFSLRAVQVIQVIQVNQGIHFGLDNLNNLGISTLRSPSSPSGLFRLFKVFTYLE